MRNIVNKLLREKKYSWSCLHNRAVGYIRNGALLAAAVGLNAIPLDWIIGGLQALEGPTGCSGIVNWEVLNQVGSTDTILDLIPAAP